MSCIKTVTGDGHKNQDVSTQMTLQRKGLEKKQRNALGFWVGLESAREWKSAENDSSRNKSLRDQPENFQGPPEVGQDSMLGHGVEKWSTRNLKLLWNWMWFSFYFTWAKLFSCFKFVLLYWLFSVSGYIRSEAVGTRGCPRGVDRGREKSSFLVGINLQKKPEFGTDYILVWKTITSLRTGPLLSNLRSYFWESLFFFLYNL